MPNTMRAALLDAAGGPDALRVGEAPTPDRVNAEFLVKVVAAGVNPIKALFWSAVVNGVISVPIMAAMMVVVARRAQMGPFVATPILVWLGWIATAVMAAAVAVMAWGQWAAS